MDSEVGIAIDGFEELRDGEESNVTKWTCELARRGAMEARMLLSEWDRLSHATRLLMARACAPPAACDGANTDSAAPAATTFHGSLAQVPTRLKLHMMGLHGRFALGLGRS